ncbi:TetR/AcrR family transcriptional regulator [Segniliparus rugosus]|uniref:HTH tetR-type domain-containing protein n=1 Tax=Segniliparus rugosus (strain ATCC BAA-974 / DSM 45345 / CCUG 50838 / CIP 108380 / JCM 13579 / CDC 945) TaxID=679197 RepID=E5XPS4_SEGRC|nr:TetR/AcrR family transcriptional regulator [Segniliparus rugosus]EFV13672.1 hypothetical protein HMPREF9336_01496 [Segniliparus rugosus ATCC BAA-974]
MTTDCPPTPPGGAKPTGRDAVVAATLTAASELFAQKGPSATSIRDIATRAGVNHGLVFRYFGAKEQLLGATLDYLADLATSLRQAGADPDEVRAAEDRQLLVGVRATLDGYPAGRLQSRFPGMELLLAEVRRRNPDERAARIATAHAVALHLGWRLFGPGLRAGLGLDDLSEAELNARIATECDRITAARATNDARPAT